MEDAMGLNDPFLLRSFRWLKQGITLNWGETNARVSRYRSVEKDIRSVILESLPRTLLVFGTAYLVMFFLSITLALYITKLYGGWLDKLVITLSPLSSAPAWIYGILINFLVLVVFRTSIFSGGEFDAWPTGFQLSHVFIILKHLTIPFLAIILSGIFQAIYAWRTFFIIYANEDYVEMAKAKGLPEGKLNRRYILKPLLPSIITSFALLFVTLWQEVIAMEYVFNVAGIGTVFLLNLTSMPPNTRLIVAIIVTFAYLLAITVFVLDLIYAWVDPRVKINQLQRRYHQTNKGRSNGLFSWIKKITQKKGSERSSLREKTRALDQYRSQSVRISAEDNQDQNQDRSPIPISTEPDQIESTPSIWVNGKTFLSRLAEYPSAIFGLAIIFLMLAISMYTVITVPYQEIIVRWRASDESWRKLPKDAPPAWINFFRKEDLPETMRFSSQDENTLINQEQGKIGVTRKNISQVSEEMTEILVTFPFEYPYTSFPQEIAAFYTVQFQEKLPLISITLSTPDGREINIGSFTANKKEDVIYFNRQDKLQRKFQNEFPVQALFSASDTDNFEPLPGNYELQVKGFFFEENPDMDVELVIYGQVYGLAGTDGNRRDIIIPLMWGMPIALMFGILAAVGTSVSSMLIAGVSTWFGGWVDNLAQRLTEVNLIIPFLPVSIMIYVLYSKSIWVILGVTVALSIFGNEIKYYRSIFLQVMEEDYIEAAQSYGANNRRLILRYLIPRILPVMIPKLVILVPSYVFLEATLTLLGVTDPVLPTWGKLLVDGISSDIFRGVYHLLLEPLSLLFLVGFAFVLLGISLEKIFQPRLRER
jgi:peptide/nickel transport system permease protein